MSVFWKVLSHFGPRYAAFYFYFSTHSRLWHFLCMIHKLLDKFTMCNCVCHIVLGANHFSWNVFLNKVAAFHDLNSHMSILRHQYLFQMLRICIHDIWERFCVAKINITYFTSKNSSKGFSFFVIHFYIQFWLVTKYCRISCGELLTQSSEG